MILSKKYLGVTLTPFGACKLTSKCDKKTQKTWKKYTQRERNETGKTAPNKLSIENSFYKIPDNNQM